MNKSYFFIFLAVIIFVCPVQIEAESSFEFAGEEMAQTLLEKVKEHNIKKIALTEVTYKKKQVELGVVLLQSIGDYLSEHSKGEFEILERADLDSIYREWGRELGPTFDGETLKEFGSLSGAGAIISGRITKSINSVRVNIKLLDLQTGRMIVSVTKKIWNTADVEEMMEN